MKYLSRRDALKAGALLPVTSAFASLPAASGGVSSSSGQEPGGTQPSSGGASPRERSLLDFGWRFHFGNANDPAKDFGFGGGQNGGFQKTGNFLEPSRLTFDDSDWKTVDLPHDWAISLPFVNEPGLSSKGFYPLGRKYPETSVGWYRRVFELPASDAGKRISVEFDGAYRESMVVFNGFYIGQHSGGYDPFSFDLTDFAIPGSPNVLLVRVDATLSDGWFYEGAGIYRHVWLVKTAPVHVKKWGTFASAQVEEGQATVSIRTEVENHSKGERNVRVISTLVGPSGAEAAKGATQPVSITERQEISCNQQLRVKQPALWSLEERNLYRIVTEVESDGAITERYETRFGIRSLKFDPESGFLLNGKPVKVKGTCNHQDHAGLGVALPDSVQYYRVRKLQDMGCNADRTSHNPPTPEFLDACDELGMLVMDETRMMSSNPEGLAQFETLVRRDRNHPSVFLWSMGNEEGEAPTEFGRRILTGMKRVAMEQDGSRPVTIAPPPFTPLGKGGLAVCDVMGYNYADPAAEQFHNTSPAIPVVGTETVSAVGTRGIYVTDKQKGYVGSYDSYTTTGRASAEGWWRFCNSKQWLAGGFVWTGFDYRGEPSPYQWPNTGSQYGIIDACGFAKDSFFYYQSWWTQKPVLHLFPHWSWPGYEGKEIAVWVYSNMDRVELFVNGQSLGAKDVPKDSHVAWNVTYAPGTIEARGYKNGRQALVVKRETTGAAARLVMLADRQQISADGEDVAMFAVEVQDAAGRTVPVTDNEITFQVTGAGTLIGVGNGDPTGHESDIGSTRRAFSGLCMAIAQSTKQPGQISIEASSPGLQPASVTISSKAVKLRPQIAVWEREVPTGPGITGLWRPAPSESSSDMMAALFGGGNDTVFTLRQNENVITGQVEAPGGFFGGGGANAIEDGQISDGKISFKAGGTTYSGALKGDHIQLQKSAPQLPGGLFSPPSPSDKPRPAIGPPPDGSDPSFDMGAFGGRAAPPMMLRRVTR
jgi:beta-galactosidase